MKEGAPTGSGFPAGPGAPNRNPPGTRLRVAPPFPPVIGRPHPGTYIGRRQAVHASSSSLSAGRREMDRGLDAPVIRAPSESMKQPVIQDILARSGLVDAPGLDRALEIQARDGGTLGRIIADLGLSSEDAVAQAIATGLGLDYLNLDETEPPAESDLCLPPEFCRRRRVLPLGVKGRSLRLAMSDPLDLGTLQDVEFRTSRRVAAVMAAESAILRMLKRLYPELEQGGMPFDLIPTVNPEGELEGSGEDDYEVVDPAELAK